MKQYLLFLRDDIIRPLGKLKINIVLKFFAIWFVSLFNNNPVDTYLVYKHRFILGYLSRKYGFIVPSKFSDKPYQDADIRNLPIWFFWYQGELPKLVKLCYGSILRNSKGRPVHLLTKENMNDYIMFPKHISRLFNEGKMTVTHLSDLLRVSLLYKYGGTWIDATVYTTSIDNSQMNPIFDSLKMHPLTNNHISDYRWATFYLFSYPRSEAMKCFRNVLYAYFRDHDYIINYLLIDYTFVMLYEKNNEFKNIVDYKAYDGEHLYDLVTILNTPVKDVNLAKTLRSAVNSKLNRKVKIEDGSTVFNELMRMSICE